jgi:Tfp pilus assembly protein PilO
METIQAWVTLVKDIVTILATSIAAGVAVMGLQAWKKQLKGKTEYELAQRVLRAAYQFREALAWVRNPLIYEGEQVQAMKDANIEGNPGDPPTRQRRLKAVYEKRW